MASVTVTPAAASLTAPDATVQLNARVLDGNGRAMPGVVVIWTSVRPEVATVGASGLVAAAGNGTTTVAATVGAVAGTATVTVAVESGDRAALAALHAATDGPNWADDENWLGDGPLGAWRGVETDAFGRVVRLDLGGRQDGETGEWVSHGLRGPIPPELGSLSGLTSLNLRANALAGPIPSELGNLTGLEELWLDGNRLEGPIPAGTGESRALEGPEPPWQRAVGSDPSGAGESHRSGRAVARRQPARGPDSVGVGASRAPEGAFPERQRAGGSGPSGAGPSRAPGVPVPRRERADGRAPAESRADRRAGAVPFRAERRSLRAGHRRVHGLAGRDRADRRRPVLQREGPGGAGRAARGGGRRGLDRLGRLAGATRRSRGGTGSGPTPWAASRPSTWPATDSRGGSRRAWATWRR